MTKIIPYQKYYDWLKKAANFSNALLYCSAIISIILLAMELFKFESEEAKEFFNSTLAWISVVYFVNDFFQNYLFHKAETLRNLDFIDNGLKSNFAEDNSVGYYSNDELNAGIYKLGVNGFENAFFTKSISAKMLEREIIKLVIVFLLFLSICFFTSNEIITTVLQLALPLTIIQQTVKLYILNSKVSQIFFNYKSTFKTTTEDNINSHILKNIINYEKVLSWAGLSLDSKLFNSMNDELSKKWIEIKNKHVKKE